MNVKNYAFLMFITIFFFFTQKDVNGNTLRDSVEMKTIPAGEFIMGSKMDEGRADERPQRKIYLDSYEIDSYEVSNNQYLNFIRSTGRKDPLNPYSEILLSDEAGVGKLPVVQVTWYDAVDYCRWAGKHLSSESQWEKAARGERVLCFHGVLKNLLKNLQIIKKTGMEYRHYGQCLPKLNHRRHMG